MKLTKTIIAISVAASSLAFSATDVGVTNFIAGNTENSLLIRDNAGNLLVNGSGSVSVGYFATLADDSFKTALDFGPIKADFQAFASGIASFGSPTVDGLFSNQLAGGTVDDASPFLDKTIYVIIGNANTLGDSDQLAIYKSGEDFSLEEGGAGAETVNLLGPVTDQNLLLGAPGAGDTIGNFDFRESIVLAAIPEPSTGLLSLIAGLGLLARRRR